MPLALFLLLLGHDPSFRLGMAKDFEKNRDRLRLRNKAKKISPDLPRSAIKTRNINTKRTLSSALHALAVILALAWT